MRSVAATPDALPASGVRWLPTRVDPVHAAYYAAHLGKSLMWTASDLITIYVMVGLGVHAAAAGSVFMAGLVVNALADVGVGAWLTRRPGDAVGLSIAGLTLSTVTFPFTVLAALHGSVALLAATLVFRAAYAAYDVPHNALMSILAPTAVAATTLSRGRTAGTAMAAVLVGLALLHEPRADHLAPVLWTLAGVAGLLGSALPILLLRHRRLAPRAATFVGPGLPLAFLLGSIAGIVALGGVAKALFHLPPHAHLPGIGTLLIVLTLGRATAALLPLRFDDVRRGRRSLALAHGLALPVVAAVAWRIDGVSIFALGLCMGMANLIGWAILPSLARSPGSYGLYTMAIKVALGVAGLTMAAAMGDAGSFDRPGLLRYLAWMALACAAAAILILPRAPARPAPIECADRAGWRRNP